VLCGGVVSFVPVVVLVFVREKTRHARLVGNKNGIKLSQQEQNAPNGEILGVQGEFCTGTGTVWLVWGEFCIGSGTVPGVLGEFCTGLAQECPVLGEFFAEEPLEAPCWANFFAEESLKALMVNVCMCARSPCGRLSSAGDTFRMQFPSRYFKL